jgi:hypothetical protein
VFFPFTRNPSQLLTQAVKSDGKGLYLVDEKMPHKDVKQIARQSVLDNHLPTTLFSRTWLSVLIDEAHLCRNPSITHAAVRRLRELSLFCCAITATPVTTKPQDLWNLGRLMGLPIFLTEIADQEADDLGKRMSSASRLDRRALLSNTDADGSIVQKVLRGRHISEEEQESNLRTAIQKGMTWLRVAFSGVVIRRTGNSKDNHGQAIIGLPPPYQHILQLQLYEHEMSNLEDLADDIATKQGDPGVYGWGKVSLIISLGVLAAHHCHWKNSARDVKQSESDV